MKTKKYLFGFLFMFLVVLGTSFSTPNVSDELLSENNAVAFAEETEETEGGEETPTEPDVEPEERFTVTVSIVGEGEVVISPSEEDFLNGAIVRVEITPKEGWSFLKLEGVELDEDDSFQIESDVTLLATFIPNQIILKDDATGVIIESTADVLPVGTVLQSSVVGEEDARYSQVKNLLSNPNKLSVFDITIKNDDEQDIDQLDGSVKLKIKLDEAFDQTKVKIFRVDVATGEKVSYDFTFEDGYVVLETDHFSLYTLSQTTGFKPASPSKDGTNKMALTLIVMGLSAVAAVIAVTVAVLVNKKKK